MKPINILLSAILVSSLFFSCNKANDDDSKGGTLLEIDPAFNCYVDENNNHFYSNVFESKDDADQFRLPVKAGVKYFISCSQPDVDRARLEMLLLNENKDTITFSNDYRGIPKIFFNSSFDNQLFLKIYPNSSYNESLEYRLYFEIADPVEENFLNINCDYVGNWEAVNSETLKFTNIDSRSLRWFRFNWTFQDNPDISFTLKSQAITELPSFGFAFNGSAELMDWSDYKQELPENSTFFNIKNNEDFLVMQFWDYSIGYNSGNIDPHNINLQSGVEFDIKHEGGVYSIYLNNAFLYSVTSVLMNRFYLVVEDLGDGEIFFEDFTIE